MLRLREHPKSDSFYTFLCEKSKKVILVRSRHCNFGATTASRHCNFGTNLTLIKTFQKRFLMLLMYVHDRIPNIAQLNLVCGGGAKVAMLAEREPGFNEVGSSTETPKQASEGKVLVCAGPVLQEPSATKGHHHLPPDASRR